MRQAGNPSSVDKLRMREMSVFKRSIPGKSPAWTHSRETLCGIFPKHDKPMNNLLKYIHSLTSFSDESWKLLQPALTQKEFKKNEFLLKEGQVCNSLFYINKGYCKSYYEIDGVVKNTG